MSEIPAAVREVIESGRLAHLVTMNADSSPQLSVVWVGLDGDEIVAAHLYASQKVKNVRRNPKVVLSIEGSKANPIGMLEYLIVHGKARITEGGAPELLQKLALRYIGPEAKFPPVAEPPAGFIMRITPERYGGIGPWIS